MRQALSLLQHPFDMCRALPDPALEVMARTLIDGPVVVARCRLKTILKWKQWKKDLEEQEAQLHASMHPDVARVMEGKNLLLLQKIADSLEWPDADLHRGLVRGFMLIGDEQPSGIFPVEPRPALASVEEFWERSGMVKHALWQKVAETPDDRLTQALFEVTEAERERGWLSAPKTWQELESSFASKWVPVRRFAVEQRDKLRPIDDLAENGVNSAFAACDKLTLRALDELVWSAAFVMRSVMHRGEVRVKLSSGEEIIGPLNDFWKADPARSRPLLKTVDLKSAYKQLAVHPDHQAACVVTIKRPHSSDVRGYVSRVLPFGAGASVTAFNRVARLIQRILQAARVINFNYFDDYPLLELSALSGSCDKVVHSILSLLGFECALDKEKDFGPSADLLGVTVDLSDSALSQVCVANKLERCAEVSTAVDQVLQRGALRAREVASLFGRIQFMEGQIMGRLGRLALMELRALCDSGGNLTLGEVETAAFRNLQIRMQSGTPRTISAVPPEGCICVFTDGACEGSEDFPVCSIGGVMYHLVEGKWCTRFFGCSLPPSIVKRWSDAGKKHLIGPVELYAVVCARRVWATYLNRSRVLLFVDHSGVHAACVSGSSKDPIWRSLLVELECADADPMMGWVARVPSPSNPADAPSRASADFPVLGECSRDEPTCCFTGASLSPLEVEKGK